MPKQTIGCWQKQLALYEHLESALFGVEGNTEISAKGKKKNCRTVGLVGLQVLISFGWWGSQSVLRM